MLSSWFGQKASDEGTIEGTTPRPSFSSPTDTQAPRASTDKPPKRAFPTAYTTPHDTVLSELQGIPSRPAATDVPNRPASFRDEQVVSPDLPESIAPRDEAPTSSTRPEGNLLSPIPTPSFPAIPRLSASNSNDILLDPFDGSSLGVLIPQQDSAINADDLSTSPPNLPSGFEGGPLGSNNIGSEAVWTQLSRILDLQSQISKKHLEMESIGTAKGSDAKRKGHKSSNQGATESSGVASGSTSGLAQEDPPVPPGLHRPRQRAMSTVSTVSSSGEPEGDEEGVNVPSEEAEKHRLREEEFAKLATQFEGRKEAINDIMGKLDDLSKALSEFHSLPPPNIEFPASRNNSVGVTSPPISTTSPKGPTKGESKATRPPLSHTTTSESVRTYDWTKQNAIPSASTLPPPTMLGRGKSDPVIIDPAPQKTAPQKKMVPTVLVNSMDVQTQTQAPVMDSPASTLGSLKLPQE
ncbi:hypothetical protein BDZ97DRAFT_1911998 [Flammula alnicola]|nr:hypothetical protein BDZ97DRAFT_1911998 [Flammula alnicola]